MSKLVDELVEEAMGVAYPEGDDNNPEDDFITCSKNAFAKRFKMVLSRNSRKAKELPKTPTNTVSPKLPTETAVWNYLCNCPPPSTETILGGGTVHHYVKLLYEFIGRQLRAGA